MIGPREITYLSVLIRIVVAFFLGGALGLEREIKSRAAGLRTYMLVCVGSCMIMLANQYIYQAYDVGDPVRMGAQVVSGIGFLGAGTIMVTQRNKITGLTTAAGLWASAAVGLCIGIGFYEAAIIGSALIILILTAVHSLDGHIRKHSRNIEIYVEVDTSISLGQFAKQLRTLGVKITSMQIDKEYSVDNTLRALLLSVYPQKKTNRQELFHQLQQLEGVVFLEDI